MVKFSKNFLVLITLLFVSVNVSAIENNQDLINLIQPATVNIITSTKGGVAIPNFVYDYENNTIVNSAKTNSFSTTTVNTSIQGNGFIISKDGIIVTHSDILTSALKTVYLSAAEKYLQNFEKKDQGYVKAYETVFNYIKENSVENIEQDIKILRPQNTYQAKVLYSNYTFENDDYIGLLKIEAENLPSVVLSDYKVNIGDSVYSINYPMLENSVSEPVFNQGIINTIKSEQYQTNILSPDELKGGPVAVKDGKIIGVLTLSGFIIPSPTIMDILSSLGINIKTSSYAEHYMAGLVLLKDKYCKSAIAEFDKTKDINPDFSVEEYIKPKVDECMAIIASGQSIDTVFDKIVFLFKNNISNSQTWFGLSLLLVLLLIIYNYFLNRFRKDEDKLKIILDEKTGEVDEVDGVDGFDMQIKSKIKKAAEHNIKTVFEPIELNPVVPSISGVKVMPIKKVEVVLRPESPQAIVTPPNAIQPEGPLVVITPFKTLNKPIHSPTSDSTEIKKDIKTDLITKKEDDII